ncbi:PAS domain S-box protein [Methanoregula boonei]
MLATMYRPNFVSLWPSTPPAPPLPLLSLPGKPCYFAGRQSAPVHPGTTAASGVRAYAIIPVNSQDHTIGCMALSSREGDEISSHARIVLETIATVIGIAIEKARADERGRANAVRLETALEMGNLAWWEMELPQGTVRFDARKATILGYSPERFVHYSDFTSLLHPEDYERTMQAMQDHITGKVPRYLVDYRICAADGSYHWFRDIGGVTRSNPDGSPQIVTGIVMDITAVKGMESELAKKHEELQAAFAQLAANEKVLQWNYAELEKSSTVLARREEEFRNLFTNMEEGLATHELVVGTDGRVADYRILSVNPSFERILGIRAAEIIGKTGKEAYKTSDSPYLDIYSRVARTRKPESFVTYFPPMDKHFRISVYSPKAGRFATIFSDISKEFRQEEALRKKNTDLEAAYEELTATGEEIRQNFEKLIENQHELRKSEERYRRIVETAREGIWAMDREFRTTFVNRQFAEFLGYPPEEMIGRDIYSYIPEDERVDLRQKLEERKIGKAGSYEWRYLTKKGEVRWGLVSATPLFAADGTFDGSFAMVTDITAQKDTEFALKEKNASLEAAYEEMTATEEELRQNLEELGRNQNDLRKSEEKFRRIVETTHEGIWMWDPDLKITFVNARMAEMHGYVEKEMLGRCITDFIDPGDRLTSDAEIKNRRQGISGHMELRQVRKDGSVIWVQISSTPLKGCNGEFLGAFAMLTDITERKRAEMALRQANRQLNLLSSITRHDILNNITVIRSHLLLAEEAAHEPSERAFLKKIGSVTHSIRDQIDFTKVYKDLGTNEPQWQALEKVIAKLALPPGISLQNETDGLEIYADLLLEKVFYNLLDNTVRHGEKADRVRITCTTASEGLVLSWEDNGAGIPDKNKEAIFDKGFGKNTGLGLFLVREILSITGITIREAGTPGSGARFEITLPGGTFRFANAGTS